MSAAVDYDVFIAYPGEDKPLPLALRDLLEPHGVRVLVDAVALKPGADISREIPDALDRSRVIAVLVSRASERGWYDKCELARAVELERAGRTLVPVLLDGLTEGASGDRVGLLPDRQLGPNRCEVSGPLEGPRAVRPWHPRRAAG